MLEVKSLVAGQRVVGLSGYGGSYERLGTVTGVVETRWGVHAEVDLDGGGRETISGLTGRALQYEGGGVKLVEGSGCGWYVVEGVVS